MLTAVDDVVVLDEGAAVRALHVDGVPGSGQHRQLTVPAQRQREGPDLNVPAPDQHPQIILLSPSLASLQGVSYLPRN